MHILDDPGELSYRARSFLARAAVRQREPGSLPERRGPAELLVSLDHFTDRYGGMRYDVRRTVSLRGERVVTVRRWQFDLLGAARAERTGWSFGWHGEHVASPVRYLAHTDGRFGVSAGGPFLEVSPSFSHLIEGHALMDELASWEPVPPSSLEAWTPDDSAGARLRELLAGLPPIAEASGPYDRWWRSEHLAIRLFHGWTHTEPRRTGIMIWSRTGRISPSP
ncbi:hypothetical protein ACTI_47670 [Actinoplanes sp. OR16]|uniref:hypothetical protein n=1 Tax=Actinoplanes sp. OR16 TaxID=946334 RepID=UPI000F6C3A59|nr:hypothetical protein [Actinoplanes sp. OR16]BBH68082.1 hypothetical protein ACTI_47670 [Actinoplanes sp. OR16]